MPQPSSLLFVNKSANSKTLSHSEGNERKHIFAHVQNLPAKAGEWIISTPSDYPSHGRLDSPFDDSTYESGNDNSQIDRKLSAKQKQRPNTQRKRHGSRSIRATSPLSILTPSALDVFANSVVPMDASTIKAFEYYCDVYPKQVSSVQPWGQMSLRSMLQHASQSPELAFALTSITFGFMHADTGDQNHEHQAMQLKGKAITHLTKSINEGNIAKNVLIPCTVWELLWLEMRRGDLESARVHYRALNGILTKMVDADTIPLTLRANLVTVTTLCAAMLAEHPLRITTFSEQYSEAADLLLDHIRALVQSDSATVNAEPMSGFFTSPNRDLVGPRLLQALQELRSIDEQRSKWYFSGEMPNRSELLEWHKQREVAQYELLSIRAGTDDSTPEQRAIQLALLLCCDLELTPTGPPAAFNRVLSEEMLSHVKEANLRGLRSSSPDLLLWVVCVTANVMEAGEQRMHLLGYARLLIDVLDIESSHELAEMMSRFRLPRKEAGKSIQALFSEILSELELSMAAL